MIQDVAAVDKIRVLVIEDNRLVREGLAALLEEQPDFTVVAAAEGANVGLAQVSVQRPHVVLVDGALGSHSSHRLVQAVRKGSPETRVIVMDLMPDQRDVIEFIKAGVSGFIVKDATVADFVNTIRSVALGGKVVPSTLTGTLLAHIADQAVRGHLPTAEEAVRMTRREREIIDLIAEGLSNKEIAARLHLATYTVKSHVHNILEKLALHSRLQIAAHAHRMNRADAPSPSK